MSVKLKKIKYTDANGDRCDGVVSGERPAKTGSFICISSCKILINGEEFTVLWELEDPQTNAKRKAPLQDENKEQELDKTPHTLPFKVMGTCFNLERQNSLERSFEMLYEYNRYVFVKLLPEPDNEHDPNSIAVQIQYEDEPYCTVGYIARELTKYIHPIINELEVTVNKIRFCTTYMRIGFYLTIDVTKNGRWDEEVIAASKNVK